MGQTRAQVNDMVAPRRLLPLLLVCLLLSSTAAAPRRKKRKKGQELPKSAAAVAAAMAEAAAQADMDASAKVRLRFIGVLCETCSLVFVPANVLLWALFNHRYITQAAEEEAARVAEEERLALLPPEPEVFMCEDCEGNTGGRCKNEITQYCTEMEAGVDGKGTVFASLLFLVCDVCNNDYVWRRGLSGGVRRVHTLASALRR